MTRWSTQDHQRIRPASEPALGSRRDDPRVEHGLHRRHGRQRRAAGDPAGPGCHGVEAQWVVEAYALLLAALLLVGGSLGDRFGRRRVFVVGVGALRPASVGCGLAPNVGQLIAARAAQGVGGALLVPGSLALISASFPEASAGRAIGTWSGFTA